MEEELLRQIADGSLLPLFSGAVILPDSKVSRGGNCVAFIDPCTIEFKISTSDSYRLRMRRSQPFAQQSSGGVTEKTVVDAFVRVLREIAPGLEKNYGDDLLSTFQRRVVAKAATDSDEDKILLQAIDQLALWATRQYEGHPIVSAIGFVPELTNPLVTFRDVCRTDFGAVLSNGFDTLLSFDSQGNFIGHIPLVQTAHAPSFAPYRQGPVAEWATDGKIALVLNRLGEILLFKDQKLLFARRSGIWHFLTHEPVLSQMGRYNLDVRHAVYESCLDASFARTGACIGLVNAGHLSKWRELATSRDDHLDAQTSVKAKAIRQMVGDKPFQKLDRRLRQELLAIDGATLLNHNGNVLAVGAILKISGGSTGGGRLAAAKAISNFGLGIKVSQDGGIRGFRDGKDEPKFFVL
jgi:hypothetical protein